MVSVTEGDGSDSGDKRPHVLVMNDVQEILDLLRELLEEEGW